MLLAFESHQKFYKEEARGVRFPGSVVREGCVGLAWLVLRIKLRSSTNSLNSLNHWAIPPPCGISDSLIQRPWAASCKRWCWQNSPRSKSQHHNKPKFLKNREGRIEEKKIKPTSKRQHQRRALCKPGGKVVHIPEPSDSCLWRHRCDVQSVVTASILSCRQALKS